MGSDLADHHETAGDRKRDSEMDGEEAIQRSRSLYDGSDIDCTPSRITMEYSILMLSS